MAANCAEELEYIKALLPQLGRKGYILKSELQQIRRGCRHQAMELNVLVRLMRDTLGEDFRYIDDTGSSDTARLCCQLDEELEKQGFEDLFSYLQLDMEAPEEDVQASLAKGRDPLCDQRAMALLQSVDRDTYRLYNQTRFIARELALRQSFGLYTLYEGEYLDYVRQIVLLTFLSGDRAKSILDGYLAYYAMMRLPEHPMKENKPEHLLPEHTQPPICKGVGRGK